MAGCLLTSGDTVLGIIDESAIDISRYRVIEGDGIETNGRGIEDG